MTDIPTLNRYLFTKWQSIRARVRTIDAEREVLIDQREFTDDETESHALADRIIRLGNEADRLENEAHEIYNRMWSADPQPARRTPPATRAQIIALMAKLMNRPDRSDTLVKRATMCADELIIALDALQDTDEQHGPEWSEAIVAAGEVYDATPCPPQPVINMDDVDEIKF